MSDSEKMHTLRFNDAVFKKALKYVKENLSACGQEVIIWNHSGILKEGHIRKAAQMFEDNLIGNPLEITKQIVIDLALGKLVGTSLIESSDATEE
jgi:hypothetical protein